MNNVNNSHTHIRVRELNFNSQPLPKSDSSLENKIDIKSPTPDTDKKINEFKEKSYFGITKKSAEFYEYLSFYAKTLNLTSLAGLLGSLSILKKLDEGVSIASIGGINKASEIIKPLSIGVQGLGELLESVELGISFTKYFSMYLEIPKLERDLDILIQKYQDEIPDEINHIKALIAAAKKELDYDKYKLIFDSVYRVTSLSTFVLTCLEGSIDINPYFYPLKLVMYSINFDRAVTHVHEAHANSELQWKIQQEFKKKKIDLIKDANDESIQKVTNIAKEKLEDISALMLKNSQDTTIDSQGKIRKYTILTERKKGIENSLKLNQHKKVLAALIEKKHEIEKPFTDLLSSKAIVEIVFASIALAIGSGITIAFFAGASTTPLGWIILALTVISVIITITFLVAHYSVLAYYKPEYFKASFLYGLTSKLLRNHYYYHLKEWWVGADKIRKEIAELQSSNRELNLNEKMHLQELEESLSKLDKDRSVLIDSVKDRLQESKWKDLINSIKDTDIDKNEIEEVAKLLKENLFDKEVLDANTYDIIENGGNWDFLTGRDFFSSSDEYIMNLRKMEALNTLKEPKKP